MKQKDNKLSRYLFIDENDFGRKLRSLKLYCPIAYKELLFDVKKELKSNKVDGRYERKLRTSKDFKFIYGQLKLIYSVNNGLITLENLEPSNFLIDGYRSNLEIYKGIYYRNNRDKFMINLFLKLKNERNYAI